MNVWKIASRWSDKGDPNSTVLDIFRKYQVLFAGRERENIKNYVKEGDLVAVSDGVTIVAIGKVISEVKPVTEFINEDDSVGRFDWEEWVVAFKVRLIHLEKDDMFTYRHGTFHSVKEPHRAKVIELFLKYQKKFSISAKSCTLKQNDQKDGHVILDAVTRYFVPIYQRPYSWSEKEIRKLLSDLFLSFWGADRNAEPEPMFIGTMQLSDKSFIKDNYYEQDIIDGQQRLTTFFILLRLLKAKFPDSKEMETHSFNWLETRVNNGEQQKSLQEFIAEPISLLSGSNNIYRQNASLISELIDEQLKDDQGGIKSLDIENFVNHILSKVYFVIIETYAGLSKTLQIFNSINTTGLDLNGGDIFKLRMYEYLRDIEHQDERAFQDISSIYEKIEATNKTAGYSVYDINQILRIYQFILIAKYNLPNALFSLGTDTFFERLFESIFKINSWENFTNINYLKLDLNEINKIIEVLDKWESMSYPTAEDNCMESFIGWSRYGRYKVLIFLFMYRYNDDLLMEQKLFYFIRQLGKLLIVYSILFQKAIGEMHTFMNSIIKNLYNGMSMDAIIIDLNKQINSSTLYKGDNKDALYDLLDGNIAYNAKMKNLVCRLSGMLDENYHTSSSEGIRNIVNIIFDGGIDIEHIQPFKDKNQELRQDIINEWGENIHSVGNLVILDAYTNRSQHNDPYLDKRNNYYKSYFQIVKNIAVNHEYWNVELCIKRKETEIQKLTSYLFGASEQI